MLIDLEATFIHGLELNKDKIFRICSAYADGSEDTEDLFQEVLITIWQALPTFKDKSTLATWMFRITLNICLRIKSNQKKRKSLIVNFDHSNLENLGVSEESSNQSIQLVHLRACVKKLSDADKSIVTLFLEELPYKQISEITGITENTIAVKVKRIKKKLYNCINEKS